LVKKGEINNLLIPKVNQAGKAPVKNTKTKGQTSEFDQVYKSEIENNFAPKRPIKISVHAAKRLKERNLDIQGEEFLKIKLAIEKLKNKGGQDSLVITDQGAYILDVKNQTIVTALDKESLKENVFTKIDSTILV
jgi:flagellar operon protein